jgi:hypothetical protein
MCCHWIPTIETSSMQYLNLFSVAPLLNLVHLPIALVVISDPQQAILWIVSLPALGALQIAAQRRTLAVIILRHRECGSAAARHQKHFQILGVGVDHCPEYTIHAC